MLLIPPGRKIAENEQRSSKHWTQDLLYYLCIQDRFTTRSGIWRAENKHTNKPLKLSFNPRDCKLKLIATMGLPTVFFS